MSLAWFLPMPGSYAGVDVVGVYNFACSLREVLAKHPFLPHGCGLFSGSYFPSFSEGLSLRARWVARSFSWPLDFPSFSEGLSLRGDHRRLSGAPLRAFPFLFGGTFIEGTAPSSALCLDTRKFPFLFGGTFIEGLCSGLFTSLGWISLPFRRDFH